MAAGKWKLYEAGKFAWTNGEVDFNSDTFKINLYSSASNANTLTAGTIDQLTDITNQLATANGYTQNDKTLTMSTSQSSGTVTVDSDDPSWTASGGSITARFAVIYDDSHGNDVPIAVCLLDTTPADVTATDGNSLTLNINASGIFTISGADSD